MSEDEGARSEDTTVKRHEMHPVGGHEVLIVGLSPPVLNQQGGRHEKRQKEDTGAQMGKKGGETADLRTNRQTTSAEILTDAADKLHNLNHLKSFQVQLAGLIQLFDNHVVLYCSVLLV